MRQSLIAILLLVTQISIGQLTVRPIQKKQTKKAQTHRALKAVSPASLPFWEDFSMTKGSNPDSIRIWEGDTASQWNYDLSKDVFVNATLAVNPPSYNVVTFDGLDVNGDFNTNSDLWADQLQSDTIDLQGRANVILSFYWQAGGNVEIPEEGDSIRLQFYNPNAAGEKWITEWKKDGGEVLSFQDSVFTQDTVQISSEYLTQDFVFRFQSFGDKDGPFDAWHLDYIFLAASKINEDYYYSDISLNVPPSSPIQPYNSIPANQLLSNISKFEGSISITSTALDKPDASSIGIPARYKVEFHELVTNTLIDSTDFGDQPLIPVNEDPFSSRSRLEVQTSDYSLSSLPSLDSIVLETLIYIRENEDTVFRTLNIDQFNDTIRTRQLFHNYYAFDDGTAEYAVGTNISGAQVAVQFWLEEEDTLTHVDFHFPNIDPISGGSLLELRIYKDLESEPIRTQDITVTNARELNEFTRYQLSRPLVLADTFYIAYEQSKNEYIGIGFDRNSPEAGQFIYENKTGQWEKNVRLDGAMMIRPVFAQAGDIVLSAEPNEVSHKIYPNPTTGVVQIDGEYHSITLMDFSGKIWAQESIQKQHDFTNLKAGLYLLTIHRSDGDQTVKIIKR